MPAPRTNPGQIRQALRAMLDDINASASQAMPAGGSYGAMAGALGGGVGGAMQGGQADPRNIGAGAVGGGYAGMGAGLALGGAIGGARGLGRALRPALSRALSGSGESNVLARRPAGSVGQFAPEQISAMRMGPDTGVPGGFPDAQLEEIVQVVRQLRELSRAKRMMQARGAPPQDLAEIDAQIEQLAQALDEAGVPPQAAMAEETSTVSPYAPNNAYSPYGPRGVGY